MKERIALTELNADLTRFTAGVHNFAARRKRTAEDVRDKHAADLRSLDGKLSTVAAQKSAAEASAEQLRQRLAQEGEDIAALDHEVQAAQAVCSTLPAEIQEIKESLDRDTNDLRRREAALGNQESIQDTKLRAMRQAVDLYRGRLGLEFRKDEREELLLVFTHLDPSDHQREFQLGVHVGPDNKYTVTRCSPALENLGGHLDELNRKDDFRGFVRKVRKLFQALVEPARR